MNNYLTLAAGVLCAGIGGELFVRGVVGIARWARIPAGIIGATVAAFATSSPELSVAITAAMAGEPQISLGNALGGNIVNVALVLGITLLISGIQCPRDSLKRDFPVALITPLIIGILALDGVLSRFDGLLLLGMFLTWMVTVIVEARKQRSAAGEILAERRGWLAIILCLAGLVFLIAAGHFIVIGAKDIAASFGLGEFVIGATVVAIGTSVPELATTVVSKIRRHDEVGLGTILGSNIFNGLFIVAIAAIISPISIDWREVAIVSLFGMVTVALIWPVRSGHIERRRGVLLLALYTVYVVTIFRS
ncbi:MAG: calcium/sodium antiporter [Sulfuricaulis sp.]|uniref:calcium/sodium antiporter n=1 Tax=Sulfuricaulis sp. TaxID=2003553 RepID=UPI0025F4AE58|nr:calcium/sodium antiporter [Sulfuricaulis sp.]MCR4347974.1 calcium/sodium antiporter [Sulfuricaulis sp.]